LSLNSLTIKGLDNGTAKIQKKFYLQIFFTFFLLFWTATFEGYHSLFQQVTYFVEKFFTAFWTGDRWALPEIVRKLWPGFCNFVPRK